MAAYEGEPVWAHDIEDHIQEAENVLKMSSSLYERMKRTGASSEVIDVMRKIVDSHAEAFRMISEMKSRWSFPSEPSE